MPAYTGGYRPGGRAAQYFQVVPCLWQRGGPNPLASESCTLEAPQQEPLLWVAGAITWSYSKGGKWKRRASPPIAGIAILSPCKRETRLTDRPEGYRAHFAPLLLCASLFCLGVAADADVGCEICPARC